MTFYQFIQAVELKMKEVVNEDTSLCLYTADKNNGVKRYGITITQKGINVSPTIYLEEYYEKFQKGCTIERIVEDIFQLYHQVRFEKSWDEGEVSTFEAVENRIIYRLVNFEANRELLKEVPYDPYLNLAIIFYVLLEVNERGTACMLIRKEHLEMWNTSIDEIWGKAKENTWHILPSEFHTMRAIMKSYKKEGNYVGMDILYVLTNKIRSFGAAVILYDGCLEMIADFLQDNYFVLPSSVHELIIVSEKDAPWGGVGLSEMVKEINRSQVDPEDILSDTTYYYDREKKKLL